MKLEKVTIEGLPTVWPPLEAMLLEKPLLWDGWSLEKIQSAVLSGQLQVWLLLDDRRIVHMVAMTQLILYAKGVALRIVWASGEDVKEGFQNIAELEELARWADCKWVEIIGRRGWERPFRQFGYKMELSLLRKAVGGGAAEGSIH